MQTPFESDLAEDTADEAMGAGEAWDEGAGDRFEEEGFEDESFEEGFEADGFEADGFEADGFEDGFESAEAEGYEEDLLEEDLYGESAGAEFEAEDFETEGDASEALENAFADAMDAADEDEFLHRVWASTQGIAQNPVIQLIGRRALPIARRLIRQAPRPVGPYRSGGVGPYVSRGGGPSTSRGVGPMVSRLLSADVLDAFADVAADYGDETLDAFTPVVAGLSARYAVRSLLEDSGRRRDGRSARALGHAITRAATAAARDITRRLGAQAIRVVPRVVRQIVRIVRRQRASPRAVAPMIRRAATRVAASPRAARQLSRPSRAARQIRARAGVGRTATRRPAARPAAGSRGQHIQRVGPGTYEIRGPVRLVFGR